MKTLIESLLDDEEELINNTDMYKAVAKTMPKKSATIKIGPSNSPSAYYIWKNPMFENIMHHSIIRINFFSSDTSNIIYFEDSEEFHISIKVHDENKYKAVKKKAEAYEALTIIKNNLEAFGKFVQELEKKQDYISFARLEDFEKEILKYK